MCCLQVSTLVSTLPPLIDRVAELESRLTRSLTIAKQGLDILADQLVALGALSGRSSPNKNPLAGDSSLVAPPRQQPVVLCSSSFARSSCHFFTGLHVSVCKTVITAYVPLTVDYCCQNRVLFAALGPHHAAITALEGKVEAVRTAMTASVKLMIQELGSAVEAAGNAGSMKTTVGSGAGSAVAGLKVGWCCCMHTVRSVGMELGAANCLRCLTCTQCGCEPCQQWWLFLLM